MKKMTDAQLRKLAEMPDDDIDYSDIPPVADFSGFVRVGNKSLDEVVKQSIDQQKLQVDWAELNQVLSDIRRAGEKDRISLRLDGDVSDYYKSQGKKYQTRINDILRAVMLLEKRARHH